jgi:hypothetical protein
MGIAPEWLMGSKFDKQSIEFLTMPWQFPDPWKFEKGRGGGTVGTLKFHELSGGEADEKDSASESDDSDLPPLEEDLSALLPPEASSQVAPTKSKSPPRARGRHIQPERPKHATSSAWLYEGRRVQIQKLEKNSSMNGVKGTLIEEVEPRKWQVRLDGSHGHKLVKLENLATLTGKPLSDFRGLDGDDGSTAAAAPLEQYCIAGTWDDWVPHDMQWHRDQKCFVFEAATEAHADTHFAICRGTAGIKKWKTRGQNCWTIKEDLASARYQIRLFMGTGGSVKKIDWIAAPLAITQ